MTPDFTERAKELRIQIDRCLPGTRDDWTTWNQDVEQACIGALEAAYMEGAHSENRLCATCEAQGYARGVEDAAQVADNYNVIECGTRRTASDKTAGDIADDIRLLAAPKETKP